MECSTETMLLDDYAQATSDYFAATDKLACLVGRHSEFGGANANVARVRERCGITRSALLNHREQHGCCAGSGSLTHDVGQRLACSSG